MANFWLAPLKIRNPSDFESKNLKKLQVIEVFLELPAGTNLKNWCYVFSWFNLLHVFKLKKNRRTPLNAKFASLFIRCKIDVWNQIEILCCQNNWLGRAETQYFMKTSSLYDIVFWNFFHKNFCELKISDGDACWEKEFNLKDSTHLPLTSSTFPQAVSFHVQSFLQKVEMGKIHWM